MTKRTQTKNMRQFEAVVDKDKKVIGFKKGLSIRPPEPRTAMEIDCAIVGYPDLGKVTTMVNEGQRVNPKRICKNLSKQ